MLMGVFHQQNLQYLAHREYKNPESLIGLEMYICLNVPFHMLPLHLCTYLFYIYLLYIHLF